MKQAILQKAIELGFDACAVTSAEPPAGAGHFRAWLQRGFHGDMDYLPRSSQKRTDPRLVLPGARSIITVASS